MSLQDTLLSTLTSYGPIVLFVSVLIASIGVPLPVSFLLIAAGAFVEQGDMNYFAVIAASVVGAVIGELQARRSLQQAGKVGVATFIGFLAGTVIKIACAFAMLAVFATALLF